MYITPSSTAKILKGVPLDINHKNTIRFTNVGNQLAYFTEKIKYSLSDCTYIREQRKLRVNKKADDLFDCNYIAYQNPNYGLKWFYAFITDVEYVNNETSYISFEIDEMQTWLLGVDYQIKPSFVEREHVSDDTVGSHIIDEGLALNDFVTNEVTEHMFTDWWICVGSTVDLRGLAMTPEGGYMYGGIYSGVSWFCFDTNTAVWLLPTIMQGLASQQKADAIVSMFMIPKDVVSELQSDGGYLQETVKMPVEISVPDVQHLDGYIPRNKKLLTYPYRSLVLTNNEGNASTLRYEFFNGGVPAIAFVGGIQPNSKIIAYPLLYKGVPTNLQEGVSVGNYPQCCWQQNIYANWLAQQSIRWGYQEDRFMRNGLTNLIGGGLASADRTLMTNNPLSAIPILSVLTNSAGVLNAQADMYSKMSEEKEVYSHVPNSVKGTIGNGYTNISIGKYGFQVESRSIKHEIAKSIDGYFDMYGYKVNALKIPNVDNRQCWNYVKTINITLVGNIPADSLAKLSKMYDNGITFWKHGSEVGDYTLNNSI